MKGMSQDLAQLLSTLIAQHRIYIHPSPAEGYKERGKTMKLPVLELGDAKQARPVWLPAAIRLLPPQGAASFAHFGRIKLSR